MKAMLFVKSGLTDRREYVLEEGKTYLVGRSREADIIVKDTLASRNHCKIVASPGDGWTVADLGSSNGTYVNRQRTTTHTFRDADLLLVGKATFEFRLTPAAPQPVEAPEAPAHEPPSPESEETDAPRKPHIEVSPPPRREIRHAGTSTTGRLDDDLRGLFEFLDKVDASDRGAPASAADAKAAQEPRREADDGEREGPLFSLLDDAAVPESGPPEPAAEAKSEGGLLAFLRKKKKPS